MADLFEPLFNLEDRYYNIGFDDGRAIGQKLSRHDARVFGIEKGFEKFVEMGELLARAKILEARLTSTFVKRPSETSNDGEGSRQNDAAPSKLQEHGLSPLPDKPRLRKHVQNLLDLMNPSAYSTENTDDAVSDIDERIKKAHSQLKIIERLTGEDGEEEPKKKRTPAPSKQTDNMEDFGQI